MKNQVLILFLLFFISCQTTQQIARVSEESYRIDSDEPNLQDSSIYRMIQPYKEQLDDEMNEVVASAAITLTKARPQSTLGNWMADATKAKAEEYLGRPVDFASLNYGGIRIPELRKGTVTRGKFYELMPFENRIVIVELDSAGVQQLMDHIADAGGWPISREVQMVIQNGRASTIKISGEVLSANKKYLVVLPDYIANGGDGSDYLIEQPRTELPDLVRDALIEYAEDLQKEGKSIDAEIDHRIKVINEK